MDRRADAGRASVGDTVGRNAAFALATQLATATFTAALTLYLVRALGAEGYGIFALAVAISGALLVPSDLGTSQAASRFVAERLGNAAEVAAVLRMALGVRLLSSVAIGAALFALAGLIADAYGEDGLGWPLRGVALAFIGQSVMRFVLNVFVAVRKTSSGLAVVASESAMEASASVVIVVLGGGVAGAAFGRAIGFLFGALLALIVLARLIKAPILRSRTPSSVSRREFAGYAGALLLVSGAVALLAQISTLLIGAIAGTAAVALFAAPLRLLALFEYPGLALASGVAPRLARNPDEPTRTAPLERALRYLLIFQLLIVAVILVWAEPIATLALGAGFEESAEVLRALAPFVLLRGISPLVSMPLNYAGEGARRVPVSIAAVLVNAAVAAALLPGAGVVGAAVGLDLAYAIYVAVHVRLCVRILGVRLRPLAATAARATLAAAAAAAVLALAGTGSLSVLEAGAGSLGSVLVFGGVLIVSGEVRPAEIRTGTRRIRALAGHAGPLPAQPATDGRPRP